MRSRIVKTLWTMLAPLARLPEWLDWLLAVVEPLVVLGITVSIGYVLYWQIFSGESGHPLQPHAYLATAMKQMSDNWKAGVILLVVLFYRTIRTFLEQADEALGVKRRKPLHGQPLSPSETQSQQ
jgi:hypothetical protein